MPLQTCRSAKVSCAQYYYGNFSLCVQRTPTQSNSRPVQDADSQTEFHSNDLTGKLALTLTNLPQLGNVHCNMKHLNPDKKRIKLQ